MPEIIAHTGQKAIRTNSCYGKLKKRGCLEQAAGDGSKILKWILDKQDESM